MRPGGGRHGQDPRDHPPDRLRRPLRRLPGTAGPRRDVHRPRRRGDAHPPPDARGRRASRPGPSTPRPFASCTTSGRRPWAGAAPEILPYKAPVVAEAASRLRLQFDRTAIRDLSAEVEWAKVTLLTPESYAAHARSAGRDPAGIDLREMARLFETYEECKTQRGVIDFEDVLLLTAGILAEREEIARTVRGQYRHFVVDEYQDVNALQQRLLDLWLGERDDVCVVGDPAQTIYSFTGASPDHLLRFPRRFPTARVVTLVRNYRSTPQVVALANLVSRAASVRTGSAVRAGSPPPAAYVELVAESPAGPNPTLRQHPDDPSEAAAVAADIAGLVREGHPAAEIAVLFRTNAQSEAFEAALSAADVPYLVRGGERFFARPEVRQGVLLLRGAVRGDDGSVPLPRSRPRHPGRRGVDARAAELGWGGPGAVGVADRPGHPGRRPRRRVAGGPRRRPGPRPRRADRRPARSGGPGRHAGLVARGEGPRVGHRLPCRLQRRVHPHHAGRGCGGHRGGAAAALRRRHPRPPRPAALLGGGAQPRRPGQPTAVPLPRPGRGRARPGRQGPRRTGPGGAGTPHRRAVRRPPVAAAAPSCPPPPSARWAAATPARPTYDETTFEALRTWRLAVARATARPRIRRLHRRHARGDRRDPTGLAGRAVADLRGRAPASSRPTGPQSSTSWAAADPELVAQNASAATKSTSEAAPAEKKSRNRNK